MKLLLLSLLAAVPCYAGKNAELKPTLAKAGKVITEQNFDTGGLEKPFTAAKGDWKVVDGAVVGKEKASDEHPAVLVLPLPSKDSIMQLSFKLDGAKALALSYNHAAGHLFRINIHPEGFTISKDPDKKDTTIKGGVLGKAESKFEKGQWYTILVEVKGTKVAVQTDNGAKAEGTDPRLAMDKINFRFVAQGESVQIDDLKITSAE